MVTDHDMTGSSFFPLGEGPANSISMWDSKYRSRPQGFSSEANDALPEHKEGWCYRCSGAHAEPSYPCLYLQVVSHGEDIHSVPLHIDVPKESDRSMHGRDPSALLTLPKNVPPMPGDLVGVSTEGAYIGEGLPPVPAKLMRKIRAGEFIEMDELLPEVWTMKE